MLMQALRKGFLRVKRKRDLAGRGLPPVACSFFSFSLCFLFSSSSFMMTGLAASALAAILTPPPETSSQSCRKVSSHCIIPNCIVPRCEGPPLGSRPADPVCTPSPPSLPSSPLPLTQSPLTQSHRPLLLAEGLWQKKPPRQGKITGSQRGWRSSWPCCSLNLDCEPLTGHAWGWLRG